MHSRTKTERHLQAVMWIWTDGSDDMTNHSATIMRVEGPKTLYQWATGQRHKYAGDFYNSDYMDMLDEDDERNS